MRTHKHSDAVTLKRLLRALEQARAILATRFFMLGELRMKTRHSMKLTHVFVVGAIAAAMCGVTNAQNASVNNKNQLPGGSMTLAPVTITGTFIHGVAPVGTNVTTITSTDIFNNGAGTTQDLLSQSPLLTSNFAAIPTVYNGGITSTYVNIHNLPGDGADPTLQLMNGMDMVGAGVLTAAPDIGIIPPGVLKSVQIVANGGDAIYGADAVGGIVNLITRKGMNGVKFNANDGWADGYSNYDADISFGDRWRTGSYIFSYDHESRQPLFGASRGYYRSYLPNDPSAGNASSVECNLANVIVNGQTYAMPNLLPGTQNTCDTDLLTSIIEPQRQNTLYFGMRQLLTSGIRFSLTAFWSDRSVALLSPQVGYEGAITNANPYFIPIDGATREVVQFNWAPVAGAINQQGGLSLHEFEVTPKFSFQLPHGWTLDWTTYLGRSLTTLIQSTQKNPALIAAALNSRTPSTALDPYDIATTPQPVLEEILNGNNPNAYVTSHQDMLETRLIAQGGIAKLPGGEARLAIGAQWQYQAYNYYANTILSNSISQGDSAAFGELMAPLIGPNNKIFGVRTLTVDVQGRYDHYTNWGSTINPKLGVDWAPLRSLLVYGTYGSSFVAPGVLKLNTDGNEAQVFATSTYGPGPFNTRPTVLLAGTTPGLKPETATTYTAGIAARPVWLPGSSIRLTYWHTAINDIQTSYPYTSQGFFYDNYPQGYIAQPTVSQLDAYIQQFDPTDKVVGFAGSLAQLNALYDSPATTPWVVINAQGQNLGSTFLDGIDFHARYAHPTPYGVLIATADGTYTLQDHVHTGPVNQSILFMGSRLYARATVGDQYHNWFGQFALDYVTGHTVDGIPDQSHVGSFHPLDALLTYNLRGKFGFKHVQVMFQVQNILNESPAFINKPPFVGNGNVLGRYFEVGLSAHY